MSFPPTRPYLFPTPGAHSLQGMAKLSSSVRGNLPKSEFGLPGERKYPMPDKSHAGNAKARAREMESKGKISKATEARIDQHANRILHGYGR